MTSIDVHKDEKYCDAISDISEIGAFSTVNLLPPISASGESDDEKSFQDDSNSMSTTYIGETSEANHYLSQGIALGGEQIHIQDKALDITSPEFDDDETVLATASGGCLPEWLAKSSPWIRWTIIICSMLLIACLSLLGVFGWEYLESMNDSFIESDQQETPNQQLPSDNFVPTVTPTRSPNNLPAADTSTHVHVKFPPTFAPSKGEQIIQGTSSPTPFELTTVLYVTGGAFTGLSEAELQKRLSQMPPRPVGDFMFHLGRWESPLETNQCDQSSYSDFADLFSVSPLHTYLVPGYEEYNDCPDTWRSELERYDERFWPTPSYTVNRQVNHEENIAFVLNKILFVGVNVARTENQDPSVVLASDTAAIEWVQEHVDKNFPASEALVIFANSGPDENWQSDGFYQPLIETIQQQTTITTIIVHLAPEGESWSVDSQFDGMEKLVVARVESGTWPPMRILIDALDNRISVEQETWFDIEVPNGG